MRKPTKETHYLIISLLTIAIAGGAYLIFSSLSPKPATITTQSKGYELLTKAQALVKEAEDNPTKEAIAKAQKAINQLKKTQSKEELQARLTAISLKHNQEDVAIKVLKAAEDNPSPELKEAAQKAISKLSDEAKKAALQARLDAIGLSKPSTAQPETATPAAEKNIAPAPAAPQIKHTTPSSGERRQHRTLNLVLSRILSLVLVQLQRTQSQRLVLTLSQILNQKPTHLALSHLQQSKVKTLLQQDKTKKGQPELL